MSDKKLDLILSEIQSMKKDLHAMKHEQQGMTDDLHSVKHEQHGMKKEISLIRKEQQKTHQKLDAVHVQVAKNTENIALLQADVKQLKDGQQSIVTSTERQEEIIDLLAKRSIEQEADLKKLKKLV